MFPTWVYSFTSQHFWSDQIWPGIVWVCLPVSVGLPSLRLSGKEPACQFRRRKRHGLDPWVRKIPWKRTWQPTPVFLPGEPHGQRSLVGYSPWGRKSWTWKLKVKVKSLSRVRLFVTPWTIAYQAPPSMRFSRQECWSGLPFPSPGDLPNPGIEPRSPALQADTFTVWATREALHGV